MRRLAILLIFTTTLFGQRHKQPEEVDAEKPDGKLLQQIMQENDAAKKTGLMEQFATEFAKSESTPWILEQLQGLYVKANNTDKVIATGDACIDAPEGKVCIDPKSQHTSHRMRLISVGPKHEVKVEKDYGTIQPYWLGEIGCDLTKKNDKDQYTPSHLPKKS